MSAESLLRKLRKDRNLPLKDLASACGMSVPGYQQIEKGIRTATAQAAKAIADYLGVPVESIFLPVSFTVRQTEEAG